MPIKLLDLSTISVSQNKVPQMSDFILENLEKAIPKYYRLFKRMVHWPLEEF